MREEAPNELPTVTDSSPHTDPLQATDPSPTPDSDGSTHPSGPIDHAAHDENLWLENINGSEQLAWVEAQNAKTLARCQDELFDTIADDIRTALDSDDRIPMVTKRGDHYFNFWRDSDHPKGLWRRTTWEDYLSESPTWEILLDLDHLAAAEDTPWVWVGATMRRSDNARVLLSLSPDGGDSHRVREFDLLSTSFVEGGFDLPAAKTRVAWMDDDTLLVATETDADSLTTSSYPRQARALRRGQKITDAPIIAEVPRDHVAIFVGSHVFDPAHPARVLVVDAEDFFTSRTSFLDLDAIRTRTGQLPGDAASWVEAWIDIAAPGDVDIDLRGDHVLFRPQFEWDLGESTVPAGALAVSTIAEVKEGRVLPRTIFTPDEHTALQSWSWTKNHLVLQLLSDVQSELRVLDPNADFTASTLPGVPADHMVGFGAVDPLDPNTADDFWLVSTGFLTPSTLARGSLRTAQQAGNGSRTEADSGAADVTGSAEASGSGRGGDVRVIKSAPALFDADGFEVSQHFATSADGTRIPYFQVAARDLVHDGDNPTLLDGYGGFEVSRTPVYSPLVGLGWLTRTTSADADGDSAIPAGRHGVYVLANIRGGGEYGPTWHTQAMRENRPRAYEDHAAVARDLIDRGVTRPERLACAGGSNGGLLVGNMLTQYPELFSAVSCGVPLLDMGRYTKLSAGYSWKAEYGDPDVPDDWEFIRTFSPYHLVADIDPETSELPPVLFWTATSDDRVGPVQARKMAARMQAMGFAEVLFYEDTQGGHSAAADNRQAAFTRALSYRFMWNALTGQ